MVDLIGDLVPNFVLIIDKNQRSIGTLIPDCVLEEAHEDTMMITKHPVQVGAAITDHAFRMPSAVRMKVGFSDSTKQKVGWCKTVYLQLLTMMSAKQPLYLVTGKRGYYNMMIAHIHVTTDETTEYVLNATVTFEEAIISNSAVAQVPSQSTVTSSVPMLTQFATSTGTYNPITTGLSLPSNLIGAS